MDTNLGVPFGILVWIETQSSAKFSREANDTKDKEPAVRGIAFGAPQIERRLYRN